MTLAPNPSFYFLVEDPLNPGNPPSFTAESSGWELALVGAPSSNETAVAESKLVMTFPCFQYIWNYIS